MTLRRRVAWAAIGIFLTGWGPLGVFWLLRGELGINPALRGWPSYRSAFVGDAVLLPALVGGLVAMSDLVTGRGQNGCPRRTWFAGIGGGLLGLALQGTWLLDDHPGTNWTLPRPHHFNVVGDYHAVFLAGCVGVVTALTVRVLTGLHREAGSGASPYLASPQLYVPAFAVTSSAVAFAGLLIIDAAPHGVPGSLSLASASSIVLLGVGLIGTASLVGVLVSDWRSVFRVVLPAGITAVAFDALTTVHLRSGGQSSLAILTAAGLAVAVAAELPVGVHRLVAAPAAGTIIAAVLLVPTAASGFDVRPAAFALCLTPILIGVLQLCQSGVVGRLTLSPFLLPSGVAALAWLGLWLDDRGSHGYLTGGLILTVTGIGFGKVLYPQFIAGFERLVTLENATSVGPVDGEGRRLKIASLGYGVAAAAAVLAETFAVAPGLGFQPGKGAPEFPLPLLAVGVALCTWLYILGLCAPRPARAKFPARMVNRRWATVLLSTTLVAAVAVGAGVALALAQAPHPGGWKLAVPVALVSMVWTYESLTLNILLQQAARVTSDCRACIALITVATGACYYAALTLGTHNHSGSGADLQQGLAVLGAACVCQVGLAVGGGTAVLALARIRYTVGGGWVQGTKALPPEGFIQDSGLLALTFALLGWLPATLMSHVTLHEERLAAIWSIEAGLLLLFSPAYFWTLRNNARHARDQRAHHTNDVQAMRRPIPSFGIDRQRLRREFAALTTTQHAQNEEQWSDLLEAHTGTQNLLSLALVVTTIVGFLPLINDAPAGAFPKVRASDPA